MENLTLRQKSVIAILVPSILMCLLLTTYSLLNHTGYVRESLVEQGERLAQDLAYVSEEALLTGNTEHVRDAITQVMDVHDVICVDLFDKNGKQVLRLAHPSLEYHSTMTFTSFVYRRARILVGRTINGVNYQDEDKRILNDPELSKNRPGIIGRVSITLSADPISREQQRVIESGVTVAGITIFLSILCGWWFSRSLARPLQSMVERVSKIRVDHDNAHQSSSLPSLPKNEIERLDLHIGLMSDEINQRILDITQARHEADNLSRAKSEFLTLISRELRNPLKAMLEMIGILKDTRLNAVQLNCLNTTHDAGHSVLSLLDNIREFSIVDKQLNASQLLLDVNGVVADVVRAFRVETDATGVTVNAKFNSEDAKLHRSYLICDPYLFRYLLHLLVSEALKTTTEGEISITIDVCERIPGRCRLDVTVEDTGLGLPPDTSQKILELLRLNKSLPIDQEIEGISKDVITIQQLVRRLKGYADIQSELEKGTKYRVRLELDSLSSEATRALISPKTKKPSSRVLMVGSGLEEKQVLIALMAHLGVKMDFVDSIQKAYDMYSESDYKVIFIECSSPEIAGFDLAEKIREKEAIQGTRSRIPLIGIAAEVSAYTLKEALRDQFYSAGLDDVIFSPFDQIEFYRIVSSHMVASQRLQQLVTGHETQGEQIRP